MIPVESIPLLQEILVSPDEVLPRLLFADWLEERGNIQSQLIRLQCERSKEAQPLLEEHTKFFRDPLVQAGIFPKYVRGFVEERVFESREFLERKIDFDAVGHLCFGVRLQAVPFVLERMIKASREASSPWRGCPISLDLTNNGLEAEGWNSLASITAFHGLIRLNLCRNELKGDAVSGFRQADRWENLASLNLSQNQLGDAGLTELCSLYEKFPQLTRLDLSQNALSGKGLKTLAASDLIDGIRMLSLAGTGIDNRDLITFLESLAQKPLLSLVELELSENRLNDSALDVLTRCPGLEMLETLSLKGNKLGNRGLKLLLESKTLSRVRQLDLSDTGINNVGARIIADSPRLRNFEKLSLEGNPITPSGYQMIAKSPFRAPGSVASWESFA